MDREEELHRFEAPMLRDWRSRVESLPHGRVRGWDKGDWQIEVKRFAVDWQIEVGLEQDGAVSWADRNEEWLHFTILDGLGWHTYHRESDYESEWKTVDLSGEVFLKVVLFPSPHGLVHGDESMWVKRVSGDDNAGTGTLDNEPLVCDLKVGDLIQYGGGSEQLKPHFIKKEE